jgi:hypothetical protein
MSNARQIVEQYHGHFANKAWAQARELLHDDLSFEGPNGSRRELNNNLSGREIDRRATDNIHQPGRGAMEVAPGDVAREWATCSSRRAAQRAR